MKKLLLLFLVTCLQSLTAAQLVDLEVLTLTNDADQKKSFDSQQLSANQPQYPRKITLNEEIDHDCGFIVKTIRNEFGPKEIDWVTETVIIHIFSGKP